MLDEGREAFALDHRLELHLHLDTAMQCGIGRALQGLRQAGVTDQPHGDQVARVEREVEEGREVAEEFRRQVLCFVDDPQRRQLLAVDQLVRSEEHTSELQSLMRISYAVFCLKKKTITNRYPTTVINLSNYNNSNH